MDMIKIAEAIKSNNKFAVAVHINPDGDCLGSAAALVITLRNMGKEAYILLDGKVPEKYAFMLKDEYFGSPDDSYEVCIAVDIASEGMMGSIKEKVFDKADLTCCFDHHETNRGYADYNCVRPYAAAAGEVVYEFIKCYLRVPLTYDASTCIYTAIVSDTAGFRYSNTSSKTHIIAAHLIENGIDAPAIMRNLFEKKSIDLLMLKNEVTSSMRFYADGKVCIASITRAQLEKHGIDFSQTDEFAPIPRSVAGVEVGVFLKDKGGNEVKASLRSNEYVDVGAVAAALGGGGHKFAAGVTIHGTADYAEKLILEAIEKAM